MSIIEFRFREVGKVKMRFLTENRSGRASTISRWGHGLLGGGVSTAAPATLRRRRWPWSGTTTTAALNRGSDSLASRDALVLEIYCSGHLFGRFAFSGFIFKFMVKPFYSFTYLRKPSVLKPFVILNLFFQARDSTKSQTITLPIHLFTLRRRFALDKLWFY